MYQLVYWPHLPGRGEPIRLLLEDAGVPYEDVARRPEAEGGGFQAVRDYLHGAGEGMPGFAPPYLIEGELRLSQMSAICGYLGPRHGLCPDDDAGRARALQLMLTVGDAMDEAHDTHHPVSSALYYEEQKAAALQAAGLFRTQRLPKWLGYFERVRSQSGGDYLMGAAASYPDLALFHLVEGLRFAFPRATARVLRDSPCVQALCATVAQRPRLSAYLRSPRRIPFNQDGIFRHYPELDDP